MEQLVVLSNLESINAVLIRQSISPTERLTQLKPESPITQMTSLIDHQSIKKLSDPENVYPKDEKMNNSSHSSLSSQHSPTPSNFTGS